MEEQNDKAKNYFNFPIQLLEGFLVDSSKVLYNIFYYALYKHAIQLKHKTDELKMKAALKYFGTNYDVNKTLSNGRKVYNSMPINSPIVGISRTTFFKYLLNEKTDFEKATLLAYLALRSIVGSKAYIRTNNKFMLSRMDGKQKSVLNFNELSEEVRKYSTEYQTRKLRNELYDNWGLCYCQSRGFFASWRLSIDRLNEIAVQNSAKSKEKFRIKEMKEARKRAIIAVNKRLNP